MLPLMLSGCETVGSLPAVIEEIDPLMTLHASALGGSDISLMRSTGRNLIAVWDATTGSP